MRPLSSFAAGGGVIQICLRKIVFSGAAALWLAGAGGLTANLPAAQAMVSLGGDPYVRPEPYHAPAIPHLGTEPLGGVSPNYRAPYNPPAVNYQPKRFVNPSLAPQHDLWCRQNHPSYRASDNSYIPYNKGGYKSGMARIPCISPSGN